MNDIDLTKCVNCRFRAKVDGKEVEGRIAVDGDYLRFFYSNGDIYSIHIPCYRKHGTDYFDDLEIVPRDPETYRDWQVGDRVCDSKHRNASHEVIFRSGELVVMKTDANTACSYYTCDELFGCGYRLVLTDIEQQIIEERKKYEPQDGDICFVRTTATDAKDSGNATCRCTTGLGASSMRRQVICRFKEEPGGEGRGAAGSGRVGDSDENDEGRCKMNYRNGKPIGGDDTARQGQEGHEA